MCKATKKQRANIDFQVADILSLGKLLRNGFAFRLGGENSSITYHRHDPTLTVPLFLHKTSFGMHVIHHVRPVAADDILPGLFSIADKAAGSSIGRIDTARAWHETGQPDTF